MTGTKSRGRVAGEVGWVKSTFTRATGGRRGAGRGGQGGRGCTRSGRELRPVHSRPLSAPCSHGSWQQQRRRRPFGSPGVPRPPTRGPRGVVPLMLAGGGRGPTCERFAPREADGVAPTAGGTAESAVAAAPYVELPPQRHRTDAAARLGGYLRNPATIVRAPTSRSSRLYRSMRHIPRGRLPRAPRQGAGGDGAAPMTAAAGPSPAALPSSKALPPSRLRATARNASPRTRPQRRRCSASRSPTRPCARRRLNRNGGQPAAEAVGHAITTPTASHVSDDERQRQEVTAWSSPWMRCRGVQSPWCLFSAP